MLLGTKDKQNINTEWDLTHQERIAGVSVKEVKNVLKNNGVLTEIYRSDWNLDSEGVGQVFQVTLYVREISAWHAHAFNTDRLFVTTGGIKLVLYDGRKDSCTYGLINEFRLSPYRPALVVIPPKVWHGVQNISDQTSIVLNVVDKAYNYQDPDHWRLPINTGEIPYSFQPRLAADS